LKIKISILFSILFVSIITAPTIIGLINEDQDISIFLSLNEEEEDNQEIKNFKEVKICPNSYSTVLLKKNKKIKTVRFTSKNYTSLFQKTTTPPPEFVF